MNPDKAQELFSVLKDLPHWEWMAGMRSTDGVRLIRLDQPYSVCAREDGKTSRKPYYFGLAKADLSDPATVGCLLAIARKGWKCGQDRRLYIAPAGEGWAPRVERIHRTESGTVAGWVADVDATRLFGDKSYPTEVEAIMEAILLAPPKAKSRSGRIE